MKSFLKEQALTPTFLNNEKEIMTQGEMLEKFEENMKEQVYGGVNLHLIRCKTIYDVTRVRGLTHKPSDSHCEKM